MQGKKVKRELIDLVKDLSTLYNRVGDSVVNLKKASDYYSAFVEFTLKKYETSFSFSPRSLYGFEKVTLFVCAHVFP